MIIIFEGSDCVGKTSLINEFSKLLPKDKIVLKHYKNPPNVLSQQLYCYQEYVFEIDRIAPWKDEIIFLYDRFYFGERVYAPIFRGYYPEYNDEIEYNIFC